MALFRAAESSAARFVGLAVSTSLFSAHAGEVLVMNSRMSLSLGNAFSRKPGSRARGGLKAGRPTDGRQAGRAQAFEPDCEASRAQQRRQLFAIHRDSFLSRDSQGRMDGGGVGLLKYGRLANKGSAWVQR